MAEFVALGLQGADKLVDKHFDKIPDKFMRPETYKPRSLGRRQQRSRSSSNSDTDSRMIRMQDNERRDDTRGVNFDRNDGAIYEDRDSRYPKTPYPYYAGAAPRDPRDIPSGSPRGRVLYAAGAGAGAGSGEVGFPRDRHLIRANSFSPPPPYRYPSFAPRGRPFDDNEVSKPSHRHRSRHRPSDAFTTSSTGIAGGALGAVVAGWATHTALEAQGSKTTPRGKQMDRALTVLGAVAGGLAANSMVDYLEDGRRDTRDDQKKWEEKFGDMRRLRDRSRGRRRDRDERWN